MTFRFACCIVLMFLASCMSETQEPTEPSCRPQFDPVAAPLNSCLGPQRVSLTFVGDLLLHAPVQKQGYAMGFDSLWHEAIPFFKEADIAVANLEGPVAAGITRSGKRVPDPGAVFDDVVYTSYPMFNYHASILSDLKKSGIDLVSTANNHSLDRFAVGADATIDALNAASLPFTGTVKAGAERNFVTLLPSQIGNVAFLSCTFSTNGVRDRRDQVLMCYENNDELMETIAQLAQDRDIAAVIVLTHWGSEYRHTPDAKDVQLAQELAKAGATAVIGTHPHVVQPLDTVTTDRGVVPIVYSTGNFVSGQLGLPKETAMIARLELCTSNQAAVVAQAGWSAARMQRDKTQSLRVALMNRADQYSQEAYDLTQNIAPGYSLRPTLRCS